jgi:hypothetical protein
MKFAPDRIIRFREQISPRAAASGSKAMWLPLGCLLMSLALWMCPPSPSRPSNVLQVRSLEVVDRAGAVRLRFGVATDGTPSVRLYDLAGTRRLELVVGADGPAVTVFDGRGVERRMLEASPGLEPTSEDAAGGP